MKIDVMHAFYTMGMIVLAFFAAIVITKTLFRYFPQNEEENDVS